MDKTAVFVDAGYLLAASAALLTGSSARSNITISHQGLVSSLIDLAECHSNLPLLRVYWYDGAKDAVPTQEHLVLARLPSVKLRLGRMTQHGQKGVDSLIVLDLVTLAQERAMTTAYLLSGDEDIREGVAAAQQMGVSVILLGVPAAGGRPNQADTLVREADDQIILDQNVVIDPHIRPIATQASSGVAGAARNISSIGPRESGYQFGANWLAAATANEKESLISQAPKIPRVLDAQLFQYAELNLGSLQGRETDRHELRAGFWDAIHRNLSPLPAADTDSGEKSSK